VAGKALVCHDCPETLTRAAFDEHIRNGRTMKDFRAPFSCNDGFNYFFSRRPTSLQHSTSGFIPLEDTSVSSVNRQQT
jgi:hypothetical protein